MPAALVVRIVFWIWVAAAIMAGRALILQRSTAGLPAVLLGLTALLVYAYFRFQSLRQWVDALDIRTLVLLHVTRFVGIATLVLYQRGELPYAYAVPGGLGDIVIATFALPVALAPLDPAKRQRAIYIWNVVGLVDILLVAATAIRLNLSEPWLMRPLTELPLSLLPTFLVPLLIAIHIVIFARLAKTPAGQ